jgi:reactive intermediate/imine deaminase
MQVRLKALFSDLRAAKMVFSPHSTSRSIEMSRTAIHTDLAPKAIGPYSQAIRADDCVYLSGQIGLDPRTGELVMGGIEAQAKRVFENLKAVAEASGKGLENVVKVNIYLTDLSHFAKVNEIMARYFQEPYPARATVGVASLPRGAQIEVDAVMGV